MTKSFFVANGQGVATDEGLKILGAIVTQCPAWSPDQISLRLAREHNITVSGPAIETILHEIRRVGTLTTPSREVYDKPLLDALPAFPEHVVMRSWREERHRLVVHHLETSKNLAATAIATHLSVRQVKYAIAEVLGSKRHPLHDALLILNMSTEKPKKPKAPPTKAAESSDRELFTINYY